MADEIDRALRFMAACGARLHHRPRPFTRSTSTPATKPCCSTTRRALTRRDSLTGGLVTTAPRTCSGSVSGPESSDGAPRRVPCAASTTRWDARSDPTAHNRRSAGDLRGSEPRPRARQAHPDQPHGRRQDRGTAYPRCSPRCADAGPSGRLGPATRCTANTYTSGGGRKTRHFDDVLSEITSFFAAHRSEGNPSRRCPRRVDRRPRSPSVSADPTTSSTRTSTGPYETMWRTPRLNGPPVGRSGIPGGRTAAVRRHPRGLGQLSLPLLFAPLHFPP